MWGVTHQTGSGVLSNKVTTKTSEVVRKGMLGKIPPIFRGETLPKPSRTDEHIKVTSEVNSKIESFEEKNSRFKGESVRMESKQQDNKQEYMTISEFARETGKSRTTVYKYLDSFLSTYVQQDAQGKKVISRAAIKALESIEAGKVVQDERTDKRSDEQINGQVEQVIEVLKEQLRVKDQQLEEKDRQIQSLHEILSRQQQLTALQEQRIIQLTAADPETAATVEHERSEEDQTAAGEKKGFFRKILDVIQGRDSY